MREREIWREKRVNSFGETLKVNHTKLLFLLQTKIQNRVRISKLTTLIKGILYTYYSYQYLIKSNLTLMGIKRDLFYSDNMHTLK